MPEVTQLEMDVFVLNYLAAAMFTTCNEEDDSEDCNKVSENARKRATEDCKKFLEENFETIIAGDEGEFTQYMMNQHGLPRWSAVLSAAGHDFWMTREGHGVGFWETPDWPEAVGEKLTKAATAFGECYATMGEDRTLEFY